MARSREIVRSSGATNPAGRIAARVATGALIVSSPLLLGGTANAAPAPMAPAPQAAPIAKADVWDDIARCESGGKWNTDTGNGYSGGLQFAPSTWKAYGGKGDASDASPAEQKRVAKKVLAGQGWDAWPSCSKKAGLSGGSSSGSSDEDSGDDSGSDDDSESDESESDESDSDSDSESDSDSDSDD
ncbi:MAG: transglycosylase family protein [Pseudonocardia sp.]